MQYGFDHVACIAAPIAPATACQNFAKVVHALCAMVTTQLTEQHDVMPCAYATECTALHLGEIERKATQCNAMLLR